MGKILLLLGFLLLNIQQVAHAEWVKIAIGETKVNDVMTTIEINTASVKQVGNNVIYWTKRTLSDKKGSVLKGRDIALPPYQYQLFSVDCRDYKSSQLHLELRDENDFEIYKSSKQSGWEYHAPGTQRFQANSLACLVNIGHKLPRDDEKVIQVTLEGISQSMDFMIDTVFRSGEVVYIWVTGYNILFPKFRTYYAFNCKLKTSKVVGSSKEFKNTLWLEIDPNSKEKELDVSGILKNKIDFICPSF